MSVSHGLLTGGCNLFFDEVTLARPLGALKLVADLSDAFIGEFEDPLLCGAAVIAVKTPVDRAVLRAEVSHVVQTRHRRRRAVVQAAPTVL